MTPATGGDMGSPASVTTASSVLERLPVGRWHWRLVAFVGIGTFFDLYEVFLGGVLAPVLAKEWGLGTLGKSMVIAAGFAGMFIGANVLSIAADRLGRRRVFILNLLVYSLFSFAAAFSPNIETFIVLRVIAGIGLGAELVLVDTYLAEFIPAKTSRPNDGVGLHDRFPRGAARSAARRQVGCAPRAPRHRRVAVAVVVRRPRSHLHHGCSHHAAGVAALAGEPRPHR
jgi:Major Facilitator Superfamily